MKSAYYGVYILHIWVIGQGLHIGDNVNMVRLGMTSMFWVIDRSGIGGIMNITYIWWAEWRGVAHILKGNC